MFEGSENKKSDISTILSTLHYICNSNKDPGSCDGSILKWYFNPVERKCEQFYYSGKKLKKRNSMIFSLAITEISCSNKIGCGGSDNRFDTKYDCTARCVHQLSSYIRMQQEMLLRQQQKIVEEQNQQRRKQLEKQDVQKQNICLQPRETGNCYNFVQRYYYDKDDKKCHKFYYSGKLVLLLRFLN